MAEFPALPLWTDAFVADTMHLSRDEVGAYILLLFTAWRRPDCDLPDDDKFLAAVTRCDGRKWRQLRPVMAQFHDIANGRWTQKRLQKERKFVDEHSKRMRENAQARWNKNKGLADATALHPQSHSNAPTPTPNKIEIISSLPVGPRPEKPRAAPQGSSWPFDAVVPEAWRRDAQAKREQLHLPPINIDVAAEMFANFWASKTGANATKKSWHRTWLNWILKENPRHGQLAGRQTALDQHLAGLAALHSRYGEVDDGS